MKLRPALSLFLALFLALFPALFSVLFPALAGLLLGTSALARPAQSGFDYLPHPAATEFDYSSPASGGSCIRRASLFVPDGPPPPGGWPVVVEVHNAGLTSTLDDTTLPITGKRVEVCSFLNAGFAVVRASLTYSTNLPGDPCAVSPPNPPGSGLFHPPGELPPGLASAPYDDPAYALAEKDVLLLMQHVRANAGELGIDAGRVALSGRSGGAIVAMWAAFGPDRSSAPGAGVDPSASESTRPDAAILGWGTTYFPAFDEAQVQGRHFPRANQTGNWSQQSNLLKDAPPAYLQAASAAVYEDAAANAAQRAYLYYQAQVQSSVLDTATPGGSDYLESALTDIHSSWHGYAWAERHPQTRLVLTTPEAVLPGHPAGVLIEDIGALTRDQVRYLFDELDVQPAFRDLGLERAGSSPGSPTLGAHRTPGGPLSIGLAGAATDQFGVYLYSAAAGPFFDIRLELEFGVSAPQILAFTTDASGAHRLSLPGLPSLPSGQLNIQAVLPTEPFDPQAWQLSNTIQITAP